jgi:hypothetical protein
MSGTNCVFISQKTQFFIGTAVKFSNITTIIVFCEQLRIPTIAEYLMQGISPQTF